MKRILTAAALAIAALAASTAALAGGVKHGSLVIKNAWTRATPPGSKVGAGYVTITNTGRAPDRLIAAKTEIAGRVEIHEMKMINGVMKMRALPNGVAVAPGATEQLKPGGNHIMFMALKRAIKQGETLSVTLTFEKAGDVKVMLPASKIGAKMMDHGKMSHGAHKSH